MEQTSILDFRTLDANIREAIFFSIFESLAEGESITLIDNQDFSKLKHQIKEVQLDNLECQDIEHGPNLWKISIKKAKMDKSESGCCGGCGGSGHS